MPNAEETKKTQNPIEEGKKDEKDVQETPTTKEEEGKKDIPQKGDDKDSGKTDDKPVEEGKNEEEKPTADDEGQGAQVDETEEGNAIPLSEVVLKRDLEVILDQRLGGLNSKIDALVKENEDLKAQNEDLRKQLDGSRAETASVREKYEVGDFGGMEPKGNGANTAPKKESWKDYASQHLK